MCYTVDYVVRMCVYVYVTEWCREVAQLLL